MFGFLRSFGGLNSIQRALLGLTALLLAAQAATAQQSPVDDYFAAFERARATLIRESDKYGRWPWTDEQQNEYYALRDRLGSPLAAAMRRIVGPVVAPKGFRGDGEWSAEVRTGLGANRLHGIAFRTGDDDRRSVLLVTTDEIMVKWMASYVLPDNPQLRGDLDTLFAGGALSAAVIYEEVWMASFANLALEKPKSVDALTVFVGEAGNGDLIWPPQLLSIYLRKEHRIYVADLALETKFSPIAACDALRAEDEEKLRTDGKNIATPFDPLARYNKCWEARGKADPTFAAAIKQAQAFVDKLAAL